MHPMDSKHFAHPIRADEFSVDGIKWEIIPAAISVLGSRYALVIKNLRKDNFDLPLDLTQVALGNSMGATGSNYIRGRVDKACLQVVGDIGTRRLRSIQRMKPVKRNILGSWQNLHRHIAVYIRNIVK